MMTNKSKYKFINLCADLVSEKKYETFLDNLFLLDAGICVPMSVLCKNRVDILSKLEPLEEANKVTLLAMWINAPNLSDGFCVIHFFEVDDHWSYIVLFNRSLFLSSEIAS